MSLLHKHTKTGFLVSLKHTDALSQKWLVHPLLASLQLICTVDTRLIGANKPYFSVLLALTPTPFDPRQNLDKECELQTKSSLYLKDPWSVFWGCS